MIIRKRKIASVVAAMAMLTFSPAAMAEYDPYCQRLADNWQGTAGQWAEWIVMCA